MRRLTARRHVPPPHLRVRLLLAPRDRRLGSEGANIPTHRRSPDARRAPEEARPDGGILRRNYRARFSGVGLSRLRTIAVSLSAAAPPIVVAANRTSGHAPRRQEP